MGRAELKAAAKRQIKGNIGILFAISLLIGLICGTISAVPVLGTIAGMVISGAFTLAVTEIYLNLTNGRKPELTDMFSQFKNILPAFCTTFLVGLYTFLWSLLFLIPGIVKACAYSQSLYILAENPNLSPSEAIDRSKQMMQGHKMEYFLLCMSFFGWALLGTFTLGILYIWLVPYMNASYANYHKYLKGEFLGE